MRNKYKHCGADSCTSHDWLCDFIKDVDLISYDLSEALDDRRKPEFVTRVYEIHKRLIDLLAEHNHVEDGSWEDGGN